MSEIVSKIEAYERNKKQEEEKEIETEMAISLKIIEEKDGIKKCVDDKIIVVNIIPTEELCKSMSDYLKEYCKTHEGKFFCTAERNCYVKAD